MYTCKIWYWSDITHTHTLSVANAKIKTPPPPPPIHRHPTTICFNKLDFKRETSTVSCLFWDADIAIAATWGQNTTIRCRAETVVVRRKIETRLASKGVSKSIIRHIFGLIHRVSVLCRLWPRNKCLPTWVKVYDCSSQDSVDSSKRISLQWPDEEAV